MLKPTANIGTINQVNQRSTLYRDNRKARLTIVYRFGNTEGNKVSRAVDDAETSRIKQGQ